MDMAKQAKVDKLVAQVACSDIVDVEVLDEMALTVIVTNKRSSLVAYRHPDILFHVEIRSLLEWLILEFVFSDEPRQLFGSVNRSGTVARWFSPHHAGPSPTEIQRLVITILGP